MNKFVVLFILSFLTLPIKAQGTISNNKAELIKNNIIKKSISTTSIVSDFIQIKHLDFLNNDIKSTGKLIFKSPNLIKWAYQTPFLYSVTFRKNELFINDDGKKSNIDLSSNKTFKSLNNLIIKSVTGDLFDENQFKIIFHENENNYQITFTPKNDSLKSIINDFILLFDKQNYQVLEIKMLEGEEDFTQIKFINQKLNTQVKDEVFNN